MTSRSHRGDPHRPRTHGQPRGWLQPAVLAVAALSVASGYASFAVVAALGEVAEAFGEAGPGETATAGAALTATTVGVGLAVVRLASLGAFALAGLADRWGRRRVLLSCVAAGLALTVAAAGAPGFWWVVAGFALARPALSATNTLAGVVAAEETDSSNRAWAVGLITAGYALGAGLTALVRLGIPDAWGFRGLFLTPLVPLVLVPLAARALPEPGRYRRLPRPERRPRLGAIRPHLRGRLAVLCVPTFGAGLVAGPVNTNVFFYGENSLGVSQSFMFAVVAAGGLFGLMGLLAGRWAADRLGRRPGAGMALAMLAGGGMLTYSGQPATLAVGYGLSLFAGGAFTPPAGSLGAELFPTSQRATAGGWLTASNVLGAVAGLVLFGVLVDATGMFAPAATLVALPVVVTATLYARLPETRGREPEDVSPEDPAAGH